MPKNTKNPKKSKKIDTNVDLTTDSSIEKNNFIKFEIHISQFTVNKLLKKRSFNQIRHCLAGHNPIWHHFLSTNIKVFQ